MTVKIGAIDVGESGKMPAFARLMRETRFAKGEEPLVDRDAKNKSGPKVPA